MTTVYIASKIAYAAKFSELRTEWMNHGLFINSRWLDQAQYEDESTPNDFKLFWQVDHQDVMECDVLVLYGEKTDKLRGALIEAGIALAFGKNVIVVGDSPDYGTWQYHPMVLQASSFEHAKTLIKRRFR